MFVILVVYSFHDSGEQDFTKIFIILRKKKFGEYVIPYLLILLDFWLGFKRW